MNKDAGDESFEKHYLKGESAHNQHFLPFVYAFFGFIIWVHVIIPPLQSPLVFSKT